MLVNPEEELACNCDFTDVLSNMHLRRVLYEQQTVIWMRQIRRVYLEKKRISLQRPYLMRQEKVIHWHLRLWMMYAKSLQRHWLDWLRS
jgi:hypothetical protein